MYHIHISLFKATENIISFMAQRTSKYIIQNILSIVRFNAAENIYYCQLWRYRN